MLKKMKKILTVILALSVVMSMLCSPAFATEPSSGTSTATGDETNPYVYYYNGYDVNVSPHKVEDSTYGVNPWLMIFRLDEENYHDANKTYDYNETDRLKDGVAVYCCDVKTNLNKKVQYKRVNLEDSTYYDEDTAKKIRGIFENGYWPDKDWNKTVAYANGKTLTKLDKWLRSLEAKVNKGLADKDKISNLTAAEALTATQAAIWNCANGNNFVYGGTSKSDYMQYVNDGTLHDPISVLYTEEQRETTENNINQLIKYLLAQEGKEQSKILFSDNYFVTSEIAFADEQGTTDGTGSTETKYDVTVNFKLSGDVDANDCLTLTATLGSETKKFSLTSKKSDSSLELITADSDGYYSISFKNVTKSVAESGILLSLSGTQEVKDVYFYQPLANNASTVENTDANGNTSSDAVRDASQNLVGKATGETKVYAEQKIDIEFGDDEGLLEKYDSSNPVDGNTVEDGTALITVNGVSYKALKGAVFSLYAVPKEKTADDKVLDSADYILVKNGLTTDDNGQITVKGLNHNKYDYFFKETKAPSGYNLDSTYHKVEWTTVELTNKKIDDKPGELINNGSFVEITSISGTVAVGNTQKSTTGHVHYDSTLVGGASTSLTLTGSKTLDGVPCGGYSFTMLGEDGKEIATVKSDASGIITFPTQTYKEAGKYRYRIFEAEGSEDVIYDDAVYTVTVDVAKSGDKLIATASIYNNNDKVDQIIFENKTDTSDKEEENGNDDSVVGGSDFGDKGTGNKDTDTTVSGSEVPKTGDMFIIWAVLAILSAAALVCTHIADRRKQSR